MTICESCHALFFQENLISHNQTMCMDTCEVCLLRARSTECDCGMAILNLMRLMRAMFGHIMELEQVVSAKDKDAVRVWRPGMTEGGLN